jgi:YjbE family integral membrane protein
MDAGYQQLVALVQVIMIDVALAGDNALVVGLAASRVSLENRARVIYWGIAGAVLLRIAFAAVTLQVFAIVGMTLAGGLLLLWVCWKMARELRRGEVRVSIRPDAAPKGMESSMPFWGAVTQIVLADVSMSLDNVLAVAAAAKGSLVTLVTGLSLSIGLMAVAASLVSRLLTRFPWLGWFGLGIILSVAVEMIWRGALEVSAAVPLQAVGGIELRLGNNRPEWKCDQKP